MGSVVRVVVLVGALAACDAPGGADEDPRLAPVGADGLVVPPASDEVALTRATDADDLFPALSGDDLVWVRVEPDPAVATPGAEVDCFACVGCTQCRWRVMHKRLPAGDEQVVWTGRYVAGAPTVDDGLMVFIDGDNVVRLVDLATLTTERIAAPSWMGRAPLVRDGLVWWHGWYGGTSGYSLLAWDVTVPGLTTQLRADVSELGFVPGGTVGGIGRGQPFVVDGARLVWATSFVGTGGIAVVDLASGERTQAFDDPDRVHVSPLVVGDGIVTLAFDRLAGCSETSCALTFQRVRDGVATPLAPDADPSVYLTPVTDGRRIVWVDKRDGPYMIVGIDPDDGRERRLTSEDARVGVISRVAFDAGRLVWSDRRSGRWRLIMRRW